MRLLQRSFPLHVLQPNSVSALHRERSVRGPLNVAGPLGSCLQCLMDKTALVGARGWSLPRFMGLTYYNVVVLQLYNMPSHNFSLELKPSTLGPVRFGDCRDRRHRTTTTREVDGLTCSPRHGAYGLQAKFEIH
ncbi:hypothetical protein EVAR_16665_1 [Eumeta japonica]|uniref:Uncharacterized protein n=1 Tax=Eumeta variegata TaxID=151549 RepID=A0A4C1V070_EUMVA|nr:hypothetical protein EVAR_16665_1 [Eumeta japonica]